MMAIDDEDDDGADEGPALPSLLCPRADLCSPAGLGQEPPRGRCVPSFNYCRNHSAEPLSVRDSSAPPAGILATRGL